MTEANTSEQDVERVPSGPFTCIRCLAGTDNDCDICDDCLAESRSARRQQNRSAPQ